MRALFVAALALLVGPGTFCGCAPEPRRIAGGAPPELHWYLDLPIEAAGGDLPAMLADPGGGLWVAVTGLATPGGRSRLYHRPPGGAWRTAHEGPFATEPSLSSLRAGEVYFGHNLPFQAFRPELLLVSDAGAATIPAPSERLDDLEYLQIGGYAMRSERDGFACGQRGALFRFDGERWRTQPPVLPWRPGDPAARSFCRSIRLDGPDRVLLADDAGPGAAWDGFAWHPIPGDEGTRLVTPASGLGRRGNAILRWEGGAWRRLDGEAPAGAPLVFDPAGRWAAHAGGVIEMGPASARALAGSLPFTPRALAEADGDLWALGPDGVHRSTRRALPTFAPAGPGGPLPGLSFAVAVDLDGDGDEDLLGLRSPLGELNGTRAALVAAVNDGAGHFTEAALGLPDDVFFWRDRFDVGDVDGDGDLDVVSVSSGGRVEVWLQDGGRFARAAAREVADATVALADVDGDGDLDLSLVPGRPSLLLNDGAGHFSEGPALPMPVAPVERALWTDVDGDGRVDALLQHWRDPAHLLHNTGHGFELLELSAVAEGAAVADVDRDGVPEILAQRIHVRGVALPFTRCRFAGRSCAPSAGPEVPAGLLVDLDLDGRLDVIGADLRGDESMAGDGEVWLASGGGGFERITPVTGALPRPTVIDADGDGDGDVYSPALGLRRNTLDAASFLRVRPRASWSDRFARGAIVVARRAGGGPIVASARADHGVVTLGLPDAASRYDLEVRFPHGERRAAPGLAAGTEITVRDADGPVFAARLAWLWALGTWLRARTVRDLVAPGVLAAAFLVARRRRRLHLPAALPLFGAAYLGLAGFLLRAGGWSWLLTPAAAAVAAVGQGLLSYRARVRARRVAGPYVLERELGSGACATVWRARLGGERVALKLFSAESMASAEARERFLREARVGGEIRHPNVVRIRDAGALPDGRCYLTMDLVEGRSLADLVKERGRLPPATARAVGIDVARALAALHDADIVHRDVKPENILVRPDGSAVLTDLGLARSALFRTLTRHDVAVGTLAYMSPEQCVGRPLSGRADLWSLGVTLYEALTGQRPFDAPHELELVYVIHNVVPRPPSALAPDVPSSLDAIVLRCLAREPEHRFASARDLESAIASAAAGA